LKLRVASQALHDGAVDLDEVERDGLEHSKAVAARADPSSANRNPRLRSADDNALI